MADGVIPDLQQQQPPVDMSALTQALAQPQPAAPPPQAQSGPPQMSSKPNVLNLIQGMINPKGQPSPTERPTSRLDVFEQFLGNFLQSMSAGLGTPPGPGANARAFAAAVPAPYQNQLKQYQLQQQARQQGIQEQDQQSQANLRGAQAQALQDQITMPDGTQVPRALAEKIMPAIIAANSRQAIAGTQAATSEANTAAKLTPDQQTFNSLVGSGTMPTAALKIVNDSKRSPTMASLLERSVSGDPVAKAAIDKLQQQRVQIADVNANRFLNRLVTAYNPQTDQVETLTGTEVVRRQAAGEQLQTIGTPGTDFVQGIQRTVTEVPASIKQVQRFLGAYDNAKDQALLAKVVGQVGTVDSSGLGIVGWMRTLSDRAAKQGLSDQGQDLLVRLSALAEIAASMRSTLGITSTQALTEQVQALIPGASTPSSQMAQKQLDVFYNIAQRAVGTPIGRRVGGNLPETPGGTGGIRFTPR